MAGITQLRPPQATGRRYGTFTGRAEASPGHPVARLTQLRPWQVTGRRYGSFAGRAAGVVPEPQDERGTGNPGWGSLWKHPKETSAYSTALNILVTIHSSVAFVRASASLIGTTDDLSRHAREALGEAETIVRQAEERRRQRQEAEQLRLQRQQDDDEELVYAASILFQEPKPITWRMKHGTKRKR